MPLTAVLDGQPIYVLDYDASALTAIASAVRKHQRSLRCKDCAHAMTVVMPTRRLWHFRHATNALATCQFSSARESDNHRDLKRRIYDMCRARGWEAEIEWHVPGTKRRADVWARDPLGRQFTFEVQLSKIPDDTSYARSIDHLQAGITPVWLIASDLRHWAFPTGAKRVRLQRHGDWVLTGLGDIVLDEGHGWMVKRSGTPHGRKTRVLEFSMLVPLLDSPVPTPEAPGHHARWASPPLVAPDSRLALPSPTVPVAGLKSRSADSLSEWARGKRLGNLDRARATGRHLRSDRASVIARLQALAGVLADAGVTDAVRYRRMSQLPASAWTREHFNAALIDIWTQRFWLRDRGHQPICGCCGLSLDESLIRSGVHVGCRRPR